MWWLLALLGCPDATQPTDLVRAVSDHDLLVTPYLQSPTPTSQWVVWIAETDTAATVDWGYTPELGHTAQGETDTDGLGLVHAVQLTGLTPDARVYYRVATSRIYSELSSFRTPPEPGSESSFVFVAMSDMQRSDSHPDKFRELIDEGVLPHLAATWPGGLADTVAGFLVTGDLVDNGWFYEEWWTDFFAPAAPLLAQVNVHPVLGNHESNSPLYFRYFHLPENGTPDLLEHWWWVDHDSVRLIGLDSNDGYRTDTQLDWLDEVLDDACTDPDLDFVIAQLHHPFHSELWPSGNLDFTGDVITRLEDFSTLCEKPSVHLFGHTHGYSRGQSAEHRHLMVNVASGGGALDPWDDGSVNYPEFSVSESDWGFVTLQVTGGDEPALALTRISRGDATTTLDNVVRDSVTVRLHDQPPDAPTGASPDGETVGQVLLIASAFSDPDDTVHAASQWQVAESCSGFDSPVADLWQQHEDRFGGADLAAGLDLTEQAIVGLAPAQSWCWRVRYRDTGLQWSPWSDGLAFTTAP